MRIVEMKKLIGPRLILRLVKASDATARYRDWLNDPMVNQFLESRFQKYTAADVRRYIKEVHKDSRSLFLAIVLKNENKHIGNIKLDSINPIHRSGVIGILIGDKSAWGLGLATEAIRLLSEYAFRRMKLHRLSARLYQTNKGS